MNRPLPTPPRIDAHQHFWQPARGDYGWLIAERADLRPIFRDFMPADLRPLLQTAGIDGTVLVQAAPTVDETLFLLDLAQATPEALGVVGWVDLAQPGAATQIEQLAQRPKLCGLRPMLQDLADNDWIAKAPIGAAVDTMRRCGLRFDALVRSAHLNALERFVDRYPDLPVVIDHLAKPRADWTDIDAWRGGLSRLARRANVCCKLSGLITEVGPAWSVAQLRPWVETVIEVFGTERVLWGSDWPVMLLAGDYARWVDASAELLASLRDDERAAIWGGNAMRFYGLTYESAQSSRQTALA